MQHVMLTPRQTKISYFFAFLLIIVMVAIASFFEDREIVLPEIAAMAIALWVYREQNWMRHPEKIFLWPTVTAILGFSINLLEISFAAKLILILISMLCFFLLFRYSLAPAIATGFLPIVTNATEYSFIISIIVTTLALMLVVMIAKLKTDNNRQPNIQPKIITVYALIIIASIGVAEMIGYVHLAVLPPVAVVIYESLHMKMYSIRMLLKQVAVLTLSALVGVLLYFYLVNWIAVVVLSLPIMWLILNRFKMRVPAVYAFPLLVYVFPQNALIMLPVAALLVSLFSLGLVLGFHWYQHREIKVNSMTSS